MTRILAPSLRYTPPSTSAVRSSRHPRRMQAVAFSSATAMAPSKSLYEVLRVKETATAAEIKTAYRSLAKRFHPDAAGSDVGRDFVEINRAYATLHDPSARAAYDSSVRRFRFPGEPAAFRSRRWETDQCW